jgi:L-histidine N-alpha-methyltransferase
VRGLTDAPRWLPCQYLYDARGSGLFEQITAQPEYYPTRTEAAILERHAGDIRRRTGPVTLIELGSGSSVKTGHLLSAYAEGGPMTYVPVDVSATAIEGAAARIARQHRTVTVAGIVGPYQAAFPIIGEHSPCLVLFLGSTVGNFSTYESLGFWSLLSKSLRGGDHVLLGVDLVKDEAVLNAAYNDAAGVTAEFTKNIFVRMNRELGAGVDVGALEHVARYNAAWQRMEIFTRFREGQTIHVAPLDASIEIGAGELVMVEISRKFVLTDLIRYLRTFGLEASEVYTDERQWFAEVLLRKE